MSSPQSNRPNISILTASSAPEFSEDELRLYLCESGPSSPLDKLLKHKRRRNIAELIGQASVIETDLAQLAVSTGFLEYFRKFKAVRVSAAGEVWATPTAFHWNSMSRMFLDVVHFGVPIHEALHGYLSHLNSSFSQGLATHLNDFGRFALAAYIRDKRTVEFEEPIKIRLPSALPGAHLALLPSSSDTNPSTRVLNWKCLDERMLSAIEELRTSPDPTCSVNISNGLDESGEVVIQKLSVLNGPCGTIAIDSFEPCLSLRSVEVYPRITDPVLCQHFLATISCALERLAAYDESLVNEMTLITASLTPMDAGVNEEAMFSGTSSAIFGACFLSATEQPLFVAEMLVHEFCHNKLRLLQEVVPLMSDKYLNRSIFYSPWRDEPRPIDGLMHGLYVFSSIADFWLHVWKDLNANEAERTIAQRRVGTLLLQLKFAFNEFSEHAELTPAGKKVFLSIINNRIAGLESQTKGWEFDRLQSLFSGVLKDQSLKEMPVLEAVPRHKKNWEANYRA